LNLQLKTQELEAEEQRIKDEIELIQFFENRVHWEDLAKEKDQLYADLELDKAEAEQTEAEYARTLYDAARPKTAKKT
jgi:hypothetical protein